MLQVLHLCASNCSMLLISVRHWHHLVSAKCIASRLCSMPTCTSPCSVCSRSFLQMTAMFQAWEHIARSSARLTSVQRGQQTARQRVMDQSVTFYLYKVARILHVGFLLDLGLDRSNLIAGGERHGDGLTLRIDLWTTTRSL